MRSILAGLAWSITLLPCSAQAQKPLPTEEAIREARKLVKVTFEQEIAAAKSPSARIELANQLQSVAERTNDDDAGQLALFFEARELGVLAVSAKTANQAVDIAAVYFQVDTEKLKVENLRTIAKLAKFSSQKRELAEEAGLLVRRAAAKDDYELAGRMLELAVTLATESRDLVVKRDITNLSEQVTAHKKSLCGGVGRRKDATSHPRKIPRQTW